MSHLKRIAMPKSWPISRSGTKYIAKVRPGRKDEFSIPALIVLRDMLNVADTKNEIRKIISMKEIIVNGRTISDYKSALGLFDVITLNSLGKSYKIIFRNGKMGVEETKETDKKICKIIGKKILSGKKQQINLFDGRNIISNEKVKVNDSVVLSLKDKKITKILPLKEKADVYIIGGKHIGEKGIIEKIEANQAIIKIGKNDVNIKLGNIFVIE
jgi:small subunit ribosomal protein S4e